MGSPPSDRDAPASWSIRAAAFLLDVVLMAAIGVVGALIAIVVTGHQLDDRTFVREVSYAICIPLGLVYAPLLLSRRGARNGQTIGKQAMRIRVVHGSGEAITLMTALRRELFGRQLAAAATYGIYAIFDYAWPLRDPAKQCLHDKLAQTRVVRASPQPASPPAPPVHETPIRGWLPPSQLG